MLLCLASLMAASCMLAQAQEPRHQFSEVEVVLSPQFTTKPSYHKLLKNYNVLQRIKETIIADLLQRDAYAEAGEMRLLISVTRFRLKSPTSTILLYQKSGRNRIEARVSVMRNGTTLDSFRHHITHLPNLFAPSRAYSFNKMLSKYSRKLSDRLTRKPHQGQTHCCPI